MNGLYGQVIGAWRIGADGGWALAGLDSCGWGLLIRDGVRLTISETTATITVEPAAN